MEPTKIRRLYRSRTNRLLAGVGGGIAEYFEIDPTLARVVLVLALLPGGPFGLLLYFVLAILIPEEPDEDDDFTI